MKSIGDTWAGLPNQARVAVFFGVIALIFVALFALEGLLSSDSDGGRSYQLGLEAGRTGVGRVGVEGGMTQSGACDEAVAALFAFQKPWDGYDADEFRRGCFDGLGGR